MDLKETIKQQGTQASVLLPELQEYVDSKVEELRGGRGVEVKISFNGITIGTNDEPDSKVLYISYISGRKFIHDMWGKIASGELKREDAMEKIKIYKERVLIRPLAINIEAESNEIGQLNIWLPITATLFTLPGRAQKFQYLLFSYGWNPDDYDGTRPYICDIVASDIDGVEYRGTFEFTD